MTGVLDMFDHPHQAVTLLVCGTFLLTCYISLDLSHPKASHNLIGRKAETRGAERHFRSESSARVRVFRVAPIQQLLRKTTTTQQH